MANIMLGLGMVHITLDAPFKLFIEPTLRQLRATKKQVWTAASVDVVRYMSVLGRTCGYVAQGSQEQSRQGTAAGDQCLQLQPSPLAGLQPDQVSLGCSISPCCRAPEDQGTELQQESKDLCQQNLELLATMKLATEQC